MIKWFKIISIIVIIALNISSMIINKEFEMFLLGAMIMEVAIILNIKEDTCEKK